MRLTFVRVLPYKKERESVSYVDELDEERPSVSRFLVTD